MECFGTADDLARSSGDGWYGARGIVLWRIDGIDGASLWGHVTTAQIDEGFAVVRAYAAAPPARRLQVCTDLARVTSFEDAIYPRMARHLAATIDAIERQVARHVVVVPDGLVRVASAGFLHLHATHRWQIAADLGAAVGEAIADKIVGLVDNRCDLDLVSALRALPVADTLPAAAKALGVAPRSLQRALHGAGTSFRALVEEGRIAAACRLLDQTDLKVEAIAREVGFQSLSGFVRSFRRALGCSPRQRRADARGHHTGARGHQLA